MPPLLQGYASLPVMALVLAHSAVRQRDRTAQVWRGYRRQVTGAAVLSPLAYVLVLIAMSFTAVSAVAPAREVSVLAGVVLGRRLLGEGGLARRLTAAAAIAPASSASPSADPAPHRAPPAAARAPARHRPRPARDRRQFPRRARTGQRAIARSAEDRRHRDRCDW